MEHLWKAYAEAQKKRWKSLTSLNIEQVTRRGEAVLGMGVILHEGPGVDFDAYFKTARTIVSCPEDDSSMKRILQLAIQFCMPIGNDDLAKKISRWLMPFRANFPRMSSYDNVLFSVHRGAWTAVKDEDVQRIVAKHWNELELPAKWRSVHQGTLGSDPGLYFSLKRVHGYDVYGVGMHAILEGNTAHLATANWVAAGYGIEISMDEFKEIGGTGPLNLSLAKAGLANMTTFRWHKLKSQRELLIAIWILATGGTYMTMHHVDSFIALCSALMVGQLYGLNVRDCKEGYAALVAVSFYARAQRDLAHVYPEGVRKRDRTIVQGIDAVFTPERMRKWKKGTETINVLLNAFAAAEGTLWSGRPLSAATGPRMRVTAVNNWASPIDNEQKPSLSYYVNGPACAHPQELNPDGSFGTPCHGRWKVATQLQDLDGLEDGIMRICLTHGNTAAADNIMAKVEREGLWVYNQGAKECVSCAYSRAIRHGFQVIADCPNRNPSQKRSNLLLSSKGISVSRLLSSQEFFSSLFSSHFSVQSEQRISQT